MTEATKNLNEAYRQKIIQLIGQTENTHILKCTYTTVHTHIQIENERKAARSMTELYKAELIKMLDKLSEKALKRLYQLAEYLYIYK